MTHTNQPDEDFLDEQDALFNAWLDGELNPTELAAFEKRLAQDPDFKSAHEQFKSIMQIVRKIPFEFAPDDFVDKVQGHIRQRSRGRFFTDSFLTQQRMPYEVVALVMMLVMAAVYILMEAPDTNVTPVVSIPSLDTPELQPPPPPAPQE